MSIEYHNTADLYVLENPAKVKTAIGDVKALWKKWI
jgi:hypothetical protein